MGNINALISVKATDDFVAHAKELAPNECCGIMVEHNGVYQYIRSSNLSDSPTNSFLLDPDLVREYGGMIKFVTHSHADTDCNPSDIDKASSEHCGIPFLILSLVDLKYFTYTPCGYRQPLEGRSFLYAASDCVTLVRDYYKWELGIEINDLVRSEAWWWVGKESSSPYRYDEIMNLTNFEKVTDDLRVGDVLAIRFQSDHINHLAVYMGDNVILHHHLGKLSGYEIYTYHWKKNTEFVIRHREMLDVRK